MSPANSLMVDPLIQPTLRDTGCNWKSAIVLPVNLNIRSEQNIIKVSRKGKIPVIVSSTLIEPAPLAGLKSLSVYGAVNNNSCGVEDIPAKNIAFLNDVTYLGLLGAPVALISVTVLPSYLVAWLAPSAQIICGVLLKLYLKKVYLVALDRPVSIADHAPLPLAAS